MADFHPLTLDRPRKGAFWTGLNFRLGLAIGAIALIALTGGGAVLAMLSHLKTATEAQRHAFSVKAELDAFKVAMLNQETGLRGYLLDGDFASLEPYRDGRLSLDRSIQSLETLLADNSQGHQRLTTAIAAARDWQKTIGEPAVAKESASATRAAAGAIEMSGEGRHRFDQFRADLADIELGEERVLATRQAETQHAQALAVTALWIGTLLTLLICASMGWVVQRQISQPVLRLATAMRRLARRDFTAEVPGAHERNEVGEMARAVEIFKSNMIELDRTSLLRATADTIPALVGYIDASRHIGFLNEAFGRWFNLPVNDVAEVYGRSIDEVFPGKSFPGAGRELDAALSGAEARLEQRLGRGGAQLRDVEASYRPHRSADGQVLGAVVLLTDMTERKALDRRLFEQSRDLQRSNEELEQFAYVASHDLKAPLRGIENLVSWIEEDLKEVLAGETRTNMDLLKNRVRRLEGLLDTLLQYSRAGRDSGDNESVDTRALVEDLAALVSPPAGFQITANPALPVVFTARAALTQVLQNLLSNAIKHHENPAHGHLWVESRAAGESVEFIVCDDGPGIPAQYRERVFGMFQTLKPRDEVEGSGMGLAIVKKLVDRYHGKIWLEDGPNGRGLRVHFTWAR